MNGRSTRRVTLLGLALIVVALIATTVLGVRAVTSIGRNDSEQALRLLCESGQKGLDSYFESVEQSIDVVRTYVETDLAELGEPDLTDHLARVRTIFRAMADETAGVLTFYYRLDPAVSPTEDGFWYVNLDGEGFVEHEVTDIRHYDTSDTEHLVWFTVPKATGDSVWLPPYVTDNLGALVVSYNAPIEWHDEFLGVIGIEIDYATLTAQVDGLAAYDEGFAFLTDEDGELIYHPNLSASQVSAFPTMDTGTEDDDLVRFTFEGTEYTGTWLPTANGMRLYVAVPARALSATWRGWVNLIIAITAALVILVAVLLSHLRRIVVAAQSAEDERRQLAEQLRSTGQLTELMGSMSSLMINMPALSFSKDAETGVYLACNQRFAEFSGRGDPSEVVGLTVFDLVDEKAAARIDALDRKALEMSEPLVIFEDVPDSTGTTLRSLQTTRQRFVDSTGRMCLLVMSVDVTEVTQAKTAETAARMREEAASATEALEEHWRANVERLSWQATHDELTGLYDRHGFDQFAGQVERATTFFLVIDIDDFKGVNDTYGHDVGDRVLVRLAEALRHHFREEDLLFRTGGDEFCVLMVSIRPAYRDIVTAKVEAINRDLGTDTEDGCPQVSVSVGVAHGSEAQSVDEVVVLADQAMYNSKHTGKHRVSFSS